MSLLEQVERLWTMEKENQVAKWAEQLKGNKNKVEDASKQFHERAPLDVYLSVTDAKNPRVSFSLRYKGQEVAKLEINGEVRVKISAQKAESNKKYFGFSKRGDFPWRGEEGAAFRKHFEKLGHDTKTKILEHRVESSFVRHMRGDSSKFGGTLRNIQPVLFADCPFQFPLPISGNTGIPKSTRGNIDILARRGIGKGTRISIWELKSPGVKAHAIEQAYIYAITLLKMLRSEKSGNFWYQDAIGFSGKIPDRLTIECVVAVSIADKKKQEEYIASLQKFKEKNSQEIGDDTIKFFVAFYQIAFDSSDSLTIDLREV